MTSDNTMNIFAVVHTQELKSALEEALDQRNGTGLDIQLGSLKGLNGQLRWSVEPDVMIFDLDVDDLEDLDALKRIRREKLNGKTALIATSAKLTPSTMRRLIRDGVDDFLPQPLTSSDVTETLHAVDLKRREKSEGERNKGHVLAFLKATGGMGATTLAVHTACALATPRRRKEPGKRVCLIDLDIQFGTAGLYLDLPSTSVLVDLIRSPERLDPDLFRGSVATHASSFDVMTAPDMPMPLDSLSTRLVTQMIDVAQQEYDYVIIDLPHALAHWTDAVLTRSSTVGVITQLTVPAIRQTRRLLELFQDEGHYTLPVSIILNRYQRHWGSNVRYRQAEKALGREFDHVVPNAYGLVMSAVNQGVPVFSTKPRSRFAKAIRQMSEQTARSLADRSQPALQPHQ